MVRALPFLAFGPNVLERGSRALWEVHLAYYYGGLSLGNVASQSHGGQVSNPREAALQAWGERNPAALIWLRSPARSKPLRDFDFLDWPQSRPALERDLGSAIRFVQAPR